MTESGIDFWVKLILSVDIISYYRFTYVITKIPFSAPNADSQIYGTIYKLAWILVLKIKPFHAINGLFLSKKWQKIYLNISWQKKKILMSL